MNEVQRVNALNEWFIGECSKKSRELVVEVIKEWDNVGGRMPLFGMWLEQRLQQQWLEWAGRS